MQVDAVRIRATELKDALDSIFQDLFSYVNCLDNELTRDKLKSVEVQSRVERGSHKGNLHAHVLISIAHYTKLQMNYSKIRAKLCTDLGLTSIHMYNRVYFDAKATLEHYIHKNQEQFKEL